MIREIGDHVVYEDSRRVGYPVDMEALAKEANYRVDRLGELLGLSPRTLQRYFITGLGVKPKYWLREQRMRNLYQLLSEGRTLDEAAARVGLQRYDYLAREVQFFEGITPEELFLETETETETESKGEGSSKEGSSLNHPRSVETMVSPSPGTGSAF